jgi:hypothetical protein
VPIHKVDPLAEIRATVNADFWRGKKLLRHVLLHGDAVMHSAVSLTAHGKKKVTNDLANAANQAIAECLRCANCVP